MKGSSQRVTGEGKVGKLKVSLLTEEILHSKKVEVRQRGREVVWFLLLFVCRRWSLYVTDFIYSEWTVKAQGGHERLEKRWILRSVKGRLTLADTPGSVSFTHMHHQHMNTTIQPQLLGQWSLYYKGKRGKCYDQLNVEISDVETVPIII